ncbi:MAG: InlB B-repeat-containing protein [Desulfuromonadaceae bacterium]|nr:InlB B-repeat-containing protein [Desulfuromonadaceae bacterium]
MISKSMKMFMFAALAILMASACVMISDTDEADAASVTIEAGQTKSFNLVSDLGWYEEPFYDDCELQFSLRYTNLVTNQSEYCNGSLSGSWGSVSFSLTNLAKAGTGTITFEAVNPEDGEILDTVSKSVTITNPHDGSSSSKPLSGFNLLLLNPQNIGSISKTLYISQGSAVSYRVQGFSYNPTATVTSGSGISKSIDSSHRVTFSGTISADCTMSVTYGSYTWSIALKTVGSGSSPSSYTCYLYYNANGGSGAPSTQSYTGTSTSSHSFTVSSSTPTRSGYTFLGWSTSSSATSATYTGGSSISVSYNGSKTLYAVWQQNVTSYTVTVYKGNWESFQVLGVDSGVVTANSKSYSVESGKRLDVDWYGKSDETGTGTNYTYTVSYDSGCYNMASSLYGSSLGDSVTVTKNASYYPAQEMGSTTSYTYQYTIKYNANGGSGAPSNTTATASTTSKSITLSSTVPTRSGYTFLGWSTSSSATSASYQAGTAYSFNYGTTQLYAVWKQATITVTGTPDSYGVVGSAWSFKPTVSVSGCSVTVSGANWLSANGTNISGTPTSPGTYNVTLTFAKSGYTSATKTFSITVLSALDFTSSPTGGAIIYAV